MGLGQIMCRHIPGNWSIEGLCVNFSWLGNEAVVYFYRAFAMELENQGIQKRMSSFRSVSSLVLNLAAFTIIRVFEL